MAKEAPFEDDQGSYLRVWVYAVVAAAFVAAALVGLLPRWPGLAHEVALPPLDLFADVRVFIARSPSIPVFLVGVIAAIVGRAALLAAVVGFTRRRFDFALRFYLAALVPAVLAAGLDFSGRAILYAYLVWAGLLVAVLTLGALGAVPWFGQESLHVALAKAGRHGFRFGTLALYLVALAIVGTVWRRPGEARQVLVVPPSAALTAVMVLRLSTPPSRLSLRRAAIVAAAAVLTIIAITVIPRSGGSSGDKVTSPPRRGSLLLVAGVDTSTGHGALFQFDPSALGFSCRQTFYYSYRGPGRGGPQGEARCPIVSGAAYSKADTTRPLRELTSGLRAQLTELPAPVVVVTHSQGAWIAWSEITADRDTPVHGLVMLAPFSQGLAQYPKPGTNGEGAAGGVAARLVTDLGRSMGINEFGPDAPLARELQGASGAVERLVARRLPRTVRAAAVLARADLPLEPRPWPHGIPEACPGWLTHAALPTSPRVAAVVDRFLDGHRLPTCPHWVAALGHTADAFGAPTPAS